MDTQTHLGVHWPKFAIFYRESAPQMLSTKEEDQDSKDSYQEPLWTSWQIVSLVSTPRILVF